jgi:hypothetical protein
MLPDPGCYEERYRLTGRTAARLAFGLFLIGTGIRWQPPVISATAGILAIPVIFSVLGVVFAMPGVIAICRRMIAFRADYAGITLGDMPTSLAALRSPAMFIPWDEVDRVILYRARPRRPGTQAESTAEGPGTAVQGIAVQRRGGATVVPGPTRTARKITGWRLDRERFAAVTAAVAPAVRIVDAGSGGSQDVAR